MGGKCKKYKETYRFLVFFEKRRLAERVGFEPTIRFRIHAFQASSLNHSDTSPTVWEVTQTSRASAHKTIVTVAPFRAWRGSQLIVARELEWATIK